MARALVANWRKCRCRLGTGKSQKLHRWIHPGWGTGRNWDAEQVGDGVEWQKIAAVSRWSLGSSSARGLVVRRSTPFEAGLMAQPMSRWPVVSAPPTRP